MKHFTVTVTEMDGRKSTHDVLATSSVEACETVLENLGRLVKTEAQPGKREAA